MATKTQPPPTVSGVNFGDLGFYVAGGGIPPGQYALEFTVQMFQAQNAQGVQKGPPRLGVMVKAHSLTDRAYQGENAHSQFYSMGTSADKSFAPNPDTGKGVIAIPGGPASTMNNSTNWAILLKSLYDCGLPNGVFTNDLSVLDGVEVITSNIPEPEERKGFQSATAEAAPMDRKPGMISVVTEILENGKPWEGGGGIPSPSATSAKEASKVAPKAAGPQKVQPIADPAASTVDEADVTTAAQSSAAEVLTKAVTPKNPTGKMNRVLFRASVFSAVKDTYSNEVAQAVANAFFTTDNALNSLLGALGYKLTGADVVPA